MFNTYALHYGDNVIAAFGIANRVVQICEFLGSGLFTGVVPLIAYAYAAGNQKRLNKVVSTTTLFFIGITLIIGAVFMVFRQQIFSLFSKDPGVLEAGFTILTAMLVSTLFTGFTSIISDMFQAFGAGNTGEHHGGRAGPGPDPDYYPWKPDAWPEWGHLVLAGGRDKRLFSGYGVMAGFRKKIYGSSS